LTPALAPQLGLLGSPPDPVGRFTMREGPSEPIVVGRAVATVFSRSRLVRFRPMSRSSAAIVRELEYADQFGQLGCLCFHGLGG
jgi:hypothetical protein